jgi:hypothetical protein
VDPDTVHGTRILRIFMRLTGRGAVDGTRIWRILIRDYGTRILADPDTVHGTRIQRIFMRLTGREFARIFI